MLTSQLTAEMMFAYFYKGKVSTHHRGSFPQPYTSWVCSIGICCDLSSEWCTAGSWCRVCSWSSAGWSDGRIPKILSALVPLLWLWPTKYLNNAGVSLWWSHIKQGLTFVSWHRFEPLLEPLTQIFRMHRVRWLSHVTLSQDQWWGTSARSEQRKFNGTKKELILTQWQGLSPATSGSRQGAESLSPI